MGRIATWSAVTSKLGVQGSSSNKGITKQELVSNYKVGEEELVRYKGNQLVGIDDVKKGGASDITNGLIFYVPFTDGTARDVISGASPVGGYTRDSFGHYFTQGGRYNISWAIPGPKGTFSIMYKAVKLGSTRNFAFGYYDKCYSYSMDPSGYSMGIWSYRYSAYVYLAGGNRQWPGGALSKTSGFWEDDYHMATFTYDFTRAVPRNPGDPVYMNKSKDAWFIYKDAVDVTYDEGGNACMYLPDGTRLSYLTIGGGIGDRTDEYTAMYVSDARIYNRMLSPAEVKQLYEYCRSK